MVEYENRLKTLISFMQQNGFVWGPSPEIYGGSAGFYTYGPNGCLLKRRVENTIRDVFAKEGIFEVETPTVMPNIVWEASGHLQGFTDPLIQDENNNVWRADKIIEEHFKKHNINEITPTDKEEMLAVIKKYDIKSPNGLRLKPEITDHSLMMHTTIGYDTSACLRPETATVTYLPFIRYAEHFRKKLPFGVYQIGRAYRNEISPRQHLMRLREFTQAEAQIFIDPITKNDYPKYEQIKKLSVRAVSWDQQVKGDKEEEVTIEQLREKYLTSDAYAYTLALAWKLFVNFGVPREKLRLRQHGPDEKAFYATDAWDVEINLPTFGWYECAGIHDRGDYDLSTHSKKSGRELSIFIEDRGEKIIPHVLEIAFGVDRPVYAIMDLFYDEKSAEEEKTTFKVPYYLAPVQVAVYPLVKKLSGKAQEVFNKLQNKGLITIYDDSGSIGKRYLRANKQGIPLCVTIDFQTIEDNTVTVRDRDTQEQKRLLLDDVSSYIKKILKPKDYNLIGC